MPTPLNATGYVNGAFTYNPDLAYGQTQYVSNPSSAYPSIRYGPAVNGYSPQSDPSYWYGQIMAQQKLQADQEFLRQQALLRQLEEARGRDRLTQSAYGLLPRQSDPVATIRRAQQAAERDLQSKGWQYNGGRWVSPTPTGSFF